MMNRAAFTRDTRTPEKRATAALFPTTYTSRPNPVRWRTTAATISSTKKNRTANGIGPMTGRWPSVSNQSGKPPSEPSSMSISARPR